MRKIFFTLILLTPVLLMPWACSNSPTSPAATETPTPVATSWPQNTYTPTSTSTYTPTGTLTPSVTPTVTFSPTITFSPTVTGTPTLTGTSTNSPTLTLTLTPYPTRTPGFVQTVSPVRYPNGLAINNGKLYVAEGDGSAAGNDVKIFNTSNLSSPVTTLTSAGPTSFGIPYGVAVNSAGTTFYVVDAGNSAVYAFDASTNAYLNSWNVYNSTSLQNPEGIAVDSVGNVYVADTGNDAVEEFDPSGAAVNSLSGGLVAFSSPSAVALDASDHLYVADADNQLVQYFNGSWNSWSTGADSDLYGITVDNSGNVYVADSGNSLVSIYNSVGVLQTQWDGSNTSNSFVSPDGVALSGGNIWVTDFENGSSDQGTLTVFGP